MAAFLKSIWAVISNLILLIILDGVYRTASTNYEVAIISLLVLIYAMISSSALVQSYIAANSIAALDGEFRRIRQLIHKKDNDDRDDIEMMQDAVGKLNTKLYLSWIPTLLLYLVAVYHIINLAF